MLPELVLDGKCGEYVTYSEAQLLALIPPVDCDDLYELYANVHINPTCNWHDFNICMQTEQYNVFQRRAISLAMLYCNALEQQLRKRITTDIFNLAKVRMGMLLALYSLRTKKTL